MAVIQTFNASRNATWAPTLAYDYPGAALPLAGATIAMQLRLYPGQPGAAYLSLGAIAFADTRLSGAPGNADEVRRLTLSPAVTTDVLQGLPEAGEPGADARFAFDIRIAYADGVYEILSSGQFILSPGVTTA
ncbi:hypothetical protein [Sphingomonas aquatilis]|uniref:hypothetical protein n=1 Tax=Sphingomonas aquatilis TaxID=93063 RepID=UPI0023F95C88|nr:hypothetical protein [Sphingomonas aquatilis]MCI4653134.1 hypothetical protein [Sphingomonas aquatilis]